MSDLISRSELLKRLATEPKYSISVPKGFEALKDLITYHHEKVIEVIEDMPTAYDVDNVVEELKTDSSVKLYGSRNSDNYMIPVNRAIEVVKQGGVSDDVCEWKSTSDGEFIQNPHTKRLYSNEPSMKNIFCNTCGKKIKVVE